jgi:hypothetical protein
MAEFLANGNGSHGVSDWSSWLKYGGIAVAAGGFFVGVMSGLWGIKDEMRLQGQSILTLVETVKEIKGNQVTPDALDSKIKMAVLELVAANPGRLSNPYSPKSVAVRTIPIKPARR